MIKKINIGLLLALTCSSSYGASVIDDVMLPPAPPFVAVTIPQQIGSFTIGGEWLYQSVVNNNLQYASGIYTNSIATPGLVNSELSSKTYSLSPDYHTAWAFDASYHFPGNGQDIQFVWTHYHHRDTETQFPGNGNSLVGPSIFNPAIVIGTFSNGWNSVKASSRNNYDGLDLLFGQKMQFGERVTIHPFTGIRYGAINVKQTASYEVQASDGLGGVDAATLVGSIKSKFQGIGFRGGFNASVRLTGNFSLIGRLGGSLLAGNYDNKVRFNSSFFDESTATTLQLNVSPLEKQGSTAVVPELDGRLGLDFIYPFSPDFALNMQIGYDITNYFGVNDTSIASYVDTIKHSNNFALQGPYFRMTVHFI